MSEAAIAVVEPPQPPAPVQQSESAALISMIERAARDPAVNIDKMERLFEMQQRAMASSAKTAFLAALATMQAVLPAVERKGKAHNDKKYARFEDIIETARPHLSANGFSLTFRIEQLEKLVKVIGVLGHKAGHTEQTDMPLPADTSGNKNAVQAWGSSISYAKRYVTLTLLGIATEDEDDDGKAAGDAKRKSSAQAKRDGGTQKFNEIRAEIANALNIEHLKHVNEVFDDDIQAMPPRWYEILKDDYDAKLEALQAVTG